MRTPSLLGWLCLLFASLPLSASDLEGRVTTADGRPLAGAKVTTSSYLPHAWTDDPTPRVELHFATTDAAGKFLIRGVRDVPGEERSCHNAVVIAPGWSVSGVHWHGAAGKAKRVSVRLRLAPAAAWRGVVVDPKGKPVPNCLVRVEQVVLNFSGKPLQSEPPYSPTKGKDGLPLYERVSPGEEFAGLLMKRTNARGEVAFAGAPKGGLLDVSVQHGDYARRRVSQLKVGSGGPARIALQPGATLTGRVVVAATGEPRSGVRLMAECPNAGGGPSITATTDKSGEYLFRNLPAGVYSLQPVLPSEYDLTAAPLKGLVLRAGAKVRAPELALTEGGVVSGVVTDADTGKPVANAGVAARAASYVRRVTTDAEGRYRLRLPAWRGYVEYAGGIPGYASWTPNSRRWVRVEEGKSVEADLKLAKGARSRYDAGQLPEVSLLPGTYPLKWVDSPGSEEYAVFLGGSNCAGWTATRPASVTREPALPKGASRRYASLRLGEPARTFIVILEESKAGKGVDALYADTDGDGNLAEERRIPMRANRGMGGGSAGALVNVVGYGARFPRAAFRCPTGDVTRTVTVEFPIYSYGGRPMRDLYYRVTGNWAGEIHTNQGKMRVALGESEGQALPGGRSRMVWLDLALADGPGLGWVPGAVQQIAEAQLIGRKLYRLIPSSLGDQLKVEVYDGPVATLKVTGIGGRGQKAAVQDVSVSGTAGSYSVEGDKEIRLPPGSYSIGYARVIVGEGKARSEITIRSRRPAALEAGKTTEVVLGGPLEMTLQGVTGAKRPGAKAAKPAVAAKRARTFLVFPRGRETQVKIELADASGSGVQPDSGAQQRKAFTASLLDARGKKVADAKIEYG